MFSAVVHFLCRTLISGKWCASHGPRHAGSVSAHALWECSRGSECGMTSYCTPALNSQSFSVQRTGKSSPHKQAPRKQAIWQFWLHCDTAPVGATKARHKRGGFLASLSRKRRSQSCVPALAFVPRSLRWFSCVQRAK